MKLEIRSVERGISPIANSTMNELFLGAYNYGRCIAHAWNNRISTSGLNPEVTIVFPDRYFLGDAKISAICLHLRQM